MKRLILNSQEAKNSAQEEQLGHVGWLCYKNFNNIVLNSTVPVRSVVMLQCSGPDTGPAESGLAAPRSTELQWSDQRPGTLKVQLRKPTALWKYNFLTAVCFWHMTHFVAI